jgi:hypothetical protein
MEAPLRAQQEQQREEGLSHQRQHPQHHRLQYPSNSTVTERFTGWRSDLQQYLSASTLGTLYVEKGNGYTATSVVNGRFKLISTGRLGMRL